MELRDVTDDDVAIFYRDQLDEEAAAMAAFPSRDEAAHFAHWAKILADDALIARTIVSGGAVVGNVVSWSQEGRQLVGYWVGKDHWGQGIATSALRLFVSELPDRPLYAFVARHNVGSIRVLEKCGFEVPDDEPQPPPHPDDVEELLLRLSSRS
jgi:RimJ/RimL family protein N-acetyltransferase